MSNKSRTTSAVLTILFGPLGLLYTTVWGALALTVLAFASAPTIIGPLFAWVVSVFWGDSIVKKHNASLYQQPVTTGPEIGTGPEPGPGPDPVPAMSPSHVQHDRTRSGVPLIPGTGEMVVYAIVIGFLVFVLPQFIGKPEGMSALVFYMDMLGI